jgi:hypothetical protein
MDTIKKWKNWYWVVVVIAVVFLGSGLRLYYLKQTITNAINNSSSDQLAHYRTAYVIPKAGEVLVLFKTTLSIDDINAFLSKNNYQSVPVTIKFNFYMQRSAYMQNNASNEKEQLQKDVDDLKAKNIIASCEELKDLPNSFPSISCLIDTKIPLEKFDLYGKYMDLEGIPDPYRLSIYVLKVPIGQENATVVKLLKQPEISSAEAPK